MKRAWQITCIALHIDLLEKAGQPVKIMLGEEFVKYYWESFEVAKKWVDYVRKK